MKTQENGGDVNMTEEERLIKNKELQEKLEYLIRTRNDISAIVRFK